MFFLIFVTRWMSSTKSVSKRLWLIYPPVGEELSKEFVRKLLVFKWIPVINISWRKHPLYDFCLVIDDQVQLESVEPAHCALALCCQSPHCLVHVHALDVTAHQRCGVDDGYARTPAQSAGVDAPIPSHILQKTRELTQIIE